MATKYWYGYNNCHVKAPWERDVLSDSESYSIELHSFQTKWNFSQGFVNSIDGGAVHCSSNCFSHHASGHVDPYFEDPDLRYKFYEPLVKARDHIPPPWEDNTIHAINTHHLTNPNLQDHHNNGDGSNGYYLNNNSSSITPYMKRRQFESCLSEGKAKNTLLYGNGVNYRDRRLPSRSVSDRRMPPSEARQQHFLRSLSFDSAIINRNIIPKYTKARTSLEEVMENVMKKIPYAQSRTNIVSDMIFNPSNLWRHKAPIDDAACFSRKLVQRILLLQLRELEPKLMGLTLNEEDFESQIWALNGLENEQIREDYSNVGLRFLLLQQRFMDIGMEAFDVLTKLRSQISHMTAEDSWQGTGILRIAVMAGNPGCSAMGSHLFFLQHFPSLEIQTNLVTEHVGWDGIVEAISVKGMEMVSLGFLEAIKHSTCLRSYRIIIFMNALGNNLQTQEEEQSEISLWDVFWNNLYRNTNAMVLVVIYETCLVWDEIKPRKGLWWFSDAPDEECIHIVRKV